MVVHVTGDVRYSFTVQFLVGATKLAREAESLEAEKGGAATESEQMVHRSHVVGAVMQATAALESEIWEVMTYGPGHHGGSATIHAAAAALLRPMAETIDSEPVLQRYALVLHLLQKPPLDKGAQPWQDADLVVKLRNEIVHYKSAWSSELEHRKFVQQLRAKRHGKPPFEPSELFPRADLSAACGLWAVSSCAAFIDTFYDRLGFRDRLNAYRARI